jgi:hypothetical protein
LTYVNNVSRVDDINKKKKKKQGTKIICFPYLPSPKTKVEEEQNLDGVEQQSQICL